MSGRDYSSISPTARMLSTVKAITDIAYARDAADILGVGNTARAVLETEHAEAFLKSSLGFEVRYLSIDHLLRLYRPRNILEVSSGFSLRGLDFSSDSQLLYIDTDLPEIVEAKRALASQLLLADEKKPPENLLFRPLNALDRAEFLAVTELLGPGPIAAVNEGLLIYLSDDEKRKFFGNVHTALSLRGGFWVTGDVYIRPAVVPDSGPAADLLRRHHMIENMFPSYSSAEKLFTECGFEIERHAFDEVLKQSTALGLLKARRHISDMEISMMLSPRETWVLRVKQM